MSNSCDPMDCSTTDASVHEDSPGKNTGVGCHFLLQGIFPIQGLNSDLLRLPTLASGFFTTSATWEACFLNDMLSNSEQTPLSHTPEPAWCFPLQPLPPKASPLSFCLLGSLLTTSPCSCSLSHWFIFIQMPPLFFSTHQAS